MTTAQHSDRALIEQLRELVTLETRLAIATREAHWNVTGPAFFSLHEMFGQQYTGIDGFIDDVAERIRQLGYTVSGSPLMGTSEVETNADDLLDKLAQKHLKVSNLLKKTMRLATDRQDEGTADLLTGLLEQHDKMVWMLNASQSEKRSGLINIPA
jgi:starvation-inducible DNA-binding protein